MGISSSRTRSPALPERVSTRFTTLKAKGQTWDKIADDNNVNLGGKKVVKKVVSKATPTPSKKTLRQEQAERYSGRTSD